MKANHIATFKLENKSTIKYLANIFGIILFTAIIFPMIWIDLDVLGNVLFIVAVIAYFLMVRFFPLLNVVGEIQFFEAGLYWKAEKEAQLSWEDIALFKFDYWGYRQGFLSQTSMGDENVILIKDRSGQEFTHFMHLGSRKDLQKLQSWLELAYENGVRIEESIGGGSSYCLKRLNYAEIQEFKSKYFSEVQN